MTRPGKVRTARERGVNSMTGGRIRIEIPEGKIKAIMDEMDQAQETIYRCYSELQNLGVVVIRQDAASGN